MAEAKKKRENFTEFEKTLILDLIEPHANTLESKKNDIKGLQARAQLWTNIVLSFNGNIGIHTHRTSAQLKELYKRLKVDARKKYTQYNKQIRGTGGGEKIQSPDKLSKIVYKLIPQDFKSLNNPYDDDDDDESTESQSLIGDKDDNSQLSTQSGTIQEYSTVPESEDFGINRPTKTPMLSKAGPSGKKRASDESLDSAMKRYAEEEHAARMELFALKKRNELAKYELLVRQTSIIENQSSNNSDDFIVSPTSKIYQAL